MCGWPSSTFARSAFREVSVPAAPGPRTVTLRPQPAQCGLCWTPGVRCLLPKVLLSFKTRAQVTPPGLRKTGKRGLPGLRGARAEGRVEDGGCQRSSRQSRPSHGFLQRTAAPLWAGLASPGGTGSGGCGASGSPRSRRPRCLFPRASPSWFRVSTATWTSRATAPSRRPTRPTAWTWAPRLGLGR